MEDSELPTIASLPAAPAPVLAQASTLLRLDPALESIKFQLNDKQVALRKARYARQRFVPPGILWENILLSDIVDQKIAADLGLAFETRTINLADADEARLWILESVLELPELNKFQKIHCHLQLKPLLLKYGRTRMAAAAQGLSLMTNPDAPHDSQAEIARASGASRTQVHKVEYLLEHADAALRTRPEAGKVTIGAGYAALQSIDAPAPQGTKYGLLYLDLPSGLGVQRLGALPIPDLTAANAALLWWVHPSDLATSIGKLRKWKFHYRCHFVLPLVHERINDFINERHDLLLLVTRGDVPTPALEDVPGSLLPPAEGAQRPEIVFTMIERLFPEATKVQVCPRAPREGWAERDFRGSKTASG